MSADDRHSPVRARVLDEALAQSGAPRSERRRRAVELLSDWALNELGLSRLLLRIERENVASIAAALAAGAQPTGITVDEEVRDRARNYGIYELLSSAT